MITPLLPKFPIDVANGPRDRHTFWLPLLLLTVAAGVVGWSMPEFYDWTGADQSRPAPVVTWIAIAIGLCNPLAWLVLLRLHWVTGGHREDTPRRGQVSLGQIMIGMAVVGLVCAVVRAGLPASLVVYLTFLVGTLYLGLFLHTLVAVINCPSRLLRLLTLLACLYLPFLWLSREAHVTDFQLLALTGLPGLVPSRLLALAAELTDERHFLLSQVFTLTEFGLGVYMIHGGPKRSWAYCLCVLSCSVLTSFAIHAMMRA